MQNEPYIVKESAGTKAYCACDKSQNMPYCDGGHKGTGISPHIVEVAEDKTVAVCGCAKSAGMPFCDGAHKNS